MSDFDEELRFHLDQRVREFMAKGATREQAEQQARAQMGDITELAAASRQLEQQQATRHRRTVWLSDLALDVRHGVRQMRVAKGFTAIAIVIMGLGIGTTTAAYATLHRLILQPIAGSHADRVVRLSGTNPERTFIVTPSREQVEAWQKLPSLEALERYTSRRMVAAFGDTVAEVEVGLMTPGLPRLLGQPLVVGRVLAPDLTEILIGDGAARRRFGSPRAALGQTIRLDGTAHTVVGVLPPGFTVPFVGWQPVEIWAAIPVSRETFANVVALHAPGIDRSTLESQLAAAMPAESVTSGPGGWTWTPKVSRPNDDLSRTTADSLLVLFAAVALVLMAGCANVANVLLTRVEARSREFAIRRVLGATNRRMARQLLTENAMLAVAGWGLGLLIAQAALALARAFRPPALAQLDAVTLDGAFVGFSVVCLIITGLLFGTAPALLVADKNLSGLTRRMGSVTGAEGRARLWRRALVALEVALSAVLLVGGLLLVRTLVAMHGADVGFRPDRLYLAEVSLPEGKHQTVAERRQAFATVASRIRTMPMINDVIVGSGVPPEVGVVLGRLEIDGRQQTLGEPTIFRFNWASAEYFEFTGTPLRAGRTFTADDVNDNVYIVSESFARLHWPGGDAIGARIRFDPQNPWSRIVGIAGDVRVPRPGAGPTSAELHIVYEPFNAPFADANLLMRVSGDGSHLYQSLASAAAEVDSAIKVADVKSIGNVIAMAQALPRFIASLLTVFSVMASLLACVGLYGVVAQNVARRRQEMGIRLALGARPSDIWRPIVSEGLTLTGIGLLAGLVCATMAAKGMASLLYRVQPLDPASFAAAAVLLGVVAILAVWVPAREVLRVSALAAIRSES